MKMRGEDWGVLLVAIVLAILVPWWVIMLAPIVPMLVLMAVCGLFRWK